MTATTALLADSLYDGACLGSDGKVYALTRLDTDLGGQYVLQWSDLTNPASYVKSQKLVNPAAPTFAWASNGLCWDTVNSCLYAVEPYSTNLSTSKYTIYKINPADMTVTTLISAVSVFTAGQLIQNDSCICTDGTHIYILCSAAFNATTANSVIRKHRCSDGVQVATLTLPNTATSGRTRGASVIGLMTGNGAGSLFVAGCDDSTLGAELQGHPWCAKIPTDLSGATQIVNLTNMYLVDDDGVAAGDFFWLGDEQGGGPKLYKVSNADLTSQTLVTHGGGSSGHVINGTDGVFFDGTFLWAQAAADGTITKINPTTNAIVATYTSLTNNLGYLPDSGYAPNEIFVSGTTVFALSADTGHNPGHATAASFTPTAPPQFSFGAAAGFDALGLT